MRHHTSPSSEGGNAFEKLRAEAQFTASLAALSGMLRNQGQDMQRGKAAEPANWEQNRPRKPFER